MRWKHFTTSTFLETLVHRYINSNIIIHHRWYYRTEEDLEGTSHWGLMATYSGSGYVQNLGNNMTQSQEIVSYLYDNLWVRRGTRVVFVDFTIYNANINLFCVVK